MSERVTIKVDVPVHKKLKRLQYKEFKQTGIQVSLSDIINEALK